MSQQQSNNNVQQFIYDRFDDTYYQYGAISRHHVSYVEEERLVPRRDVSIVLGQAQQSLVYSNLCSRDTCIVCKLSVSCCARRGRCRHSICTCSCAAGARRGRCRHNLCTGSSAAGARIGRCRHSPCTCSSASGARRGCCCRSLCIGSSAAGARRG